MNLNDQEPLHETDLASEDELSGDAQRLAETEERLAYLTAEFENYKRQTARRLDEERARAKRRVLEEIFPAIDNFNLALQHAGTAKDVASLKIGLDFIAQQLETALQSAGLQPIVAVGQAFDPTRHDALEEIEVAGTAPGTVVEEAQRGYTLDGQILRPSRVKVAK